jgi:hypothetical protein
VPKIAESKAFGFERQKKIWNRYEHNLIFSFTKQIDKPRMDTDSNEPNGVEGASCYVPIMSQQN